MVHVKQEVIVRSLELLLKCKMGLIVPAVFQELILVPQALEAKIARVRPQRVSLRYVPR